MIDPRAGEARVEIAQMVAEYGEIPEAITLWEQIEREFDGLSFDPETRELRRQEVSDTLAELRNGVRPVYHKEAIPIQAPKPDVPPAALAPSEPPRLSKPPQSQYGKVGRNERCPCGSGKKYKQCHGRSK
jgi:preprotein translocase subunit SecA